MREFLRQHRVLHIWLGAAVGALLLFYLFREMRAVMNFWVFSIALPFRRGMGAVTGLIPFSVAEILMLALIVTVIGLFLREIYRMRRQGRDRTPVVRGIYRIVAGLLAIVLSAYAGLTLLYGTNFYADSFTERAGIYERGGSVEDLERITALFAAGLNNTAHLVPRDEAGVFDVPIQQIFEESLEIFRPFEEEFPFLAMRDRRPKPLLLSPLMARTDYVGFYFPFTGEANINVRMPRSQMPVVVLHEFAHQRGVASEDEANFVAILAGVKSGNPLFVYSAYQMGYSYLSNALHRIDPERFRAIHETLSADVLADFADIRAYHERKNPTAQQVTHAMNDRMLRSYGETSGVQSYGEVVDLLLVWF